MNKIILMGNVGKDPIIENGRAEFTLAVNEKRNGEKKTTWFRCVKFKYFDVIEKFVRKGSHLIVIGKLEIQDVEKNGHLMKYVSVIVDEIEFAGSSKQPGGDTPVTDMIGEVPQKKQKISTAVPVDVDDDLPF